MAAIVLLDVFNVIAEDGLSLRFFLPNIMAAMGHDDPSLLFNFKFPF